MLVIENQACEVLLERRPQSGIWGGLWSFPEQEPDTINHYLRDRGLQCIDQSPLRAFRHTFTHFHLDIEPIRIKVSEETQFITEPGKHTWFDRDNPLEIGLAGPVSKLLESLQGN